MLGTGSNVDRAKASRVLAGTNTTAAFSGSSSTKSCLSGDLRAWTSQTISAATSKESDGIYRKVGSVLHRKIGFMLIRNAETLFSAFQLRPVI